MTYAKELDDLHQEIRLSTAGTVRFWPKIDGTGNVVASATPADNAFTVVDESGSQVQGATNATVTSVSSVSRLDLAVSAIATLGEYFALVAWKQSGGSTYGPQRVPFTVARYPLSESQISLNDLVTLSDQADVICLRIGVKRGISASTAAEEMASVFGYEGRCALDELLRNEIIEGRVAPSQGTVADVQYGGLCAYVRPRLILDTTKLVRVQRFLAAAAMFRADQTGATDDPSDRLRQLFEQRAQSALKSLGPLRYDGSEAGAVSAILDKPGTSVRMSR